MGADVGQLVQLRVGDVGGEGFVDGAGAGGDRDVLDAASVSGRAGQASPSLVGCPGSSPIDER